MKTLIKLAVYFLSRILYILFGLLALGIAIVSFILIRLKTL
jgi:hypothetical protein